MRKVAEILVKYRMAIASLVAVIFFMSAVSIFNVNVNMDMTRYLPSSLQVKQGMDIMNDEFGECTTLRIMVKDVPEGQRQTLANEIADFDFVVSVDYEANSSLYNKDEYTYYEVVVEGNSYATETQKESDSIDTIIASRGYESWNATVLGDGTDDLMPIFALAIFIAMIILFILATSWIEPLLMLLTIVIAVGINMGTNVFLPSVSNTTFTIAAILQMALSMDYLIMLMNRYRAERATKDPEEAMVCALEKGVIAIASSSVTTVVGLLCLCLMSFTIGMDMGFVLAKGVFISLICVFTFLPAVAIALDPVMQISQKPFPQPKLKGLTTFSYKMRVVVLIAFVAIFAFGYSMRDKVSIDYLGNDTPTEAQQVVDEKFPPLQQLVVVCSNEKASNTWSVIEKFAAREDVYSLQSYENMIGNEMTADKMAESYDVNLSVVKMVYYYYKHNAELGVVDKDALVSYLNNELKTDLEGLVDDESLEGIATLSEAIDSVSSGTYSPAQLCSAVNMHLIDEDSVRLMYLAYLAHFDYDESWTMNADVLTSYLTNTMIDDPTFSNILTSDIRKTLISAREAVVDGAAALRGENYSRYIMEIPYSADSQEMSDLVTELKQAMAANVGSGYYLVGEGPMVQDMAATFGDEFNFISIVTIIAILIIVLLTFRTLVVPVLLVALIQSAYCWDMAFNYFIGNSLYYICLIIVQSILMGAAIDYAILYTTNYRESRETMNVRDAMQDSYQRSFRTVAMSGGILVVVTGIIGVIATGITGMICLIIAEGAAISVILVTFILPGSLAVLDKLAVPKKKRFESKSAQDAAPAKPVEPDKPVEPVEPSEPTGVDGPGEPVEPLEPSRPTGVDDSAQLNKVKRATHSAESIKSAQQVESEKVKRAAHAVRPKHAKN